MGNHLPQEYFASLYQFQRFGIIPWAATIGTGERYLIAPEQVVQRYGNANSWLRGSKDRSLIIATLLWALSCMLLL
jgi:hypothetical protein